MSSIVWFVHTIIGVGGIDYHTDPLMQLHHIGVSSRVEAVHLDGIRDSKQNCPVWTNVVNFTGQGCARWFVTGVQIFVAGTELAMVQFSTCLRHSDHSFGPQHRVICPSSSM